MTLVVVLLLMSALAVGGLYTARSALLGERLARNQLDVSVARQAAEAAMRDAEKDLMLAGADPTGAVCSRGSARPVMSAIAYFSASCKAGQCQSMPENQRLVADYSLGGSPGSISEAWWPTTKGGLWNNTTSSKPNRDDSAKPATCDSFTGGVPMGIYTGVSAIVGVSQQPEYMIEAVRRNATYIFRITARGFGLRSGSEVVLQSYFQVPEL